MICPQCNGYGGGVVIACPGAILLWMECDACHGTGEAPDEMAEWRARGKVCKQWRMEPVYRNMQELSELIGLDVVTISSMERGRIDPSPLEEALRILEGGNP